MIMRAAADGEDGSPKNVIMENRLYPLREMLAELPLEVGQRRRRRRYETALRQTLNRYRASGSHARPMWSAIGPRPQVFQQAGNPR